MKRILLLSDTHSHMDERIIHYSKDADEIWHAGDIGNLNLSEIFNKPLRAVYGNIDGEEIRNEFSLDQRFFCERVDVLMTHIGGYPQKYLPRVKELLDSNPPNLFICGHSHVLKVMFDKAYCFLHINPGASGKYGPHQIRTLVKFSIKKDKISNLDIVELS